MEEWKNGMMGKEEKCFLTQYSSIPIFLFDDLYGKKWRKK
jgi:hypothetical protein